MTTPEIQEIIVPPINQRERIPQAAIDDVVKQIAEKFKPKKIILFGSYAYGTPNQVSDVDLLVVMETDLREVQQEIKILQTIKYDFALDVLVKTPQSLQERISLGDNFLKEIVERGKLLYG